MTPAERTDDSYPDGPEEQKSKKILGWSGKAALVVGAGVPAAIFALPGTAEAQTEVSQDGTNTGPLHDSAAFANVEPAGNNPPKGNFSDPTRNADKTVSGYDPVGAELGFSSRPVTPHPAAEPPAREISADIPASTEMSPLDISPFDISHFDISPFGAAHAADQPSIASDLGSLTVTPPVQGSDGVFSGREEAEFDELTPSLYYTVDGSGKTNVSRTFTVDEFESEATWELRPTDGGAGPEAIFHFTKRQGSDDPVYGARHVFGENPSITETVRGDGKDVETHLATRLPDGTPKTVHTYENYKWFGIDKVRTITTTLAKGRLLVRQTGFDKSLVRGKQPIEAKNLVDIIIPTGGFYEQHLRKWDGPAGGAPNWRLAARNDKAGPSLTEYRGGGDEHHFVIDRVEIGPTGQIKSEYDAGGIIESIPKAGTPIALLVHGYDQTWDTKTLLELKPFKNSVATIAPVFDKDGRLASWRRHEFTAGGGFASMVGETGDKSEGSDLPDIDGVVSVGDVADFDVSGSN